MQAVETFTHNGRKVQIFFDEDPPNPCKDYDQLTTLACWHRRANLGNRRIEGGISASLLVGELERGGEKVLAILPLYLYQHGGMSMSTGSFSCPFDSGQVGWGYVTQESAEKMGCVGPTYDKAFFEKAITEDVETYNLYLTGQCYGYVVSGADGGELDSCWGFIGDLAYVREEAKCVALHSVDPAVEREVEALAKRVTYAG